MYTDINAEINNVLQKYNNYEIEQMARNVDAEYRHLLNEYNRARSFNDNNAMFQLENLIREQELRLEVLRRALDYINSTQPNAYMQNTNMSFNRFNDPSRNVNSNMNNGSNFSTRRINYTIERNGFNNRDNGENVRTRKYKTDYTGYEERGNNLRNINYNETNNFTKGNNMLITKNNTIIGSTIPLATTNNSISLNDGVLCFDHTVSSNNTDMVQILTFKCNEFNPLAFQNKGLDNNEVHIAFRSENVNSLTEIVDKLHRIMNLDENYAINLIIDTLINISTKELDDPNIHKVIKKDSTFTRENLNELTIAIDSSVNAVSSLSELNNRLKRENREYFNNIYTYVFKYIIANYTNTDEGIARNHIAVNIKVSNAFNTFNFINCYNNFKNFICTRNCNPGLYELITKVYTEFNKSFTGKKFSDFIDMVIDVEDEFGFKYYISVSKRLMSDFYYIAVIDNRVELN